MTLSQMFLPLNLQFFAQADDGGGTGDNPEGDNQNQDPQGQGVDNKQGHDQNGNDGSQQNQNEHMIPKSRFDEVNEQYKTLKAQLDEITQAKEQEEIENKKKQGEFETLYNETSQELETYKSQVTEASERVEQLEGIIQTLVDAELEVVPEEMRDLVPENFTPEQKLSWITNAKQKGLFGTQKPSKQEQELGGSTNNQQQTDPDVSKMTVAELLRSAYGKK